MYIFWSAFDHLLPLAPAVQASDVVALSAGFDGYQYDPLLELRYSLDMFYQLGSRLTAEFPNTFAHSRADTTFRPCPNAFSTSGRNGWARSPIRREPTVSGRSVWERFEANLAGFCTIWSRIGPLINLIKESSIWNLFQTDIHCHHRSFRASGLSGKRSDGEYAEGRVSGPTDPFRQSKVSHGQGTDLLSFRPGHPGKVDLAVIQIPAKFVYRMWWMNAGGGRDQGPAHPLPRFKGGRRKGHALLDRVLDNARKASDPDPGPNCLRDHETPTSG